MNKYERICPVCGETFVTKYSTKRFCCADCISEYEDIKRYLSGRVKEVLLEIITEARTTSKTDKQLYTEFMKKW